MKKFLLFLLVLFATISKAQDTPGLYYNGQKMSYSRMVGTRVGNAFGAVATGGLTTVKINRVVEGQTAELVVAEKKARVYCGIWRKRSYDRIHFYR